MTTAAVISLLLAAFGVWVTWSGMRLAQRRWKQEQAESASAEQRRVRSQAQLVWVSTERRPWPRQDEGEYEPRVASVRNDSSGPVYDLVLWWFLDGAPIDDHHHPHRAGLAPGAVWAEPEPVWLTHMGDHRQVSAALWFADTEGRHWETDQRGQLRTLREAVAQGY